MSEFSPDPYSDSTPAFSVIHQRLLEAEEATRPYAAISKAQLLGLLGAFGDGFARGGGREALDAMGNSAAVRQLHEILSTWYRQWHRPWRRQPVETGVSLFFTPHERQCISIHKYLRGFELVDENSLLALIRAIAEYSILATPLPLYAPADVLNGGVNRARHAHNALIAFRDRPFTQADFARSINVVVEGYPVSLEYPILDHVEWVRR